jgi:hypothetical protein
MVNDHYDFPGLYIGPNTLTAASKVGMVSPGNEFLAQMAQIVMEADSLILGNLNEVTQGSMSTHCQRTKRQWPRGGDTILYLMESQTCK